MNFDLTDLIGYLGMALILLAYFLLQKGTFSSTSKSYLFTNLFGSAFLLVSLYFKPNPAAITLQIIWIAISLYGLYKCYSSKA